MNNLLRGKKLVGINDIMKFVNVTGAETILRWKKEFDFPAVKEAGIYVAFAGDIKKWLKEFPEVKETTRPLIDVFRTRETVGRFGQKLITIKKYQI